LTQSDPFWYFSIILKIQVKMDKFKIISIIGAGHLGSAFARGLIKSGHPANSIIFSNRDSNKLARLVKEISVLSAQSNALAVEHSDVTVIAVKPQFMQNVCQDIAATIQNKRPLIISLAGVASINKIERWLNYKDLGIIRVMTNTPMEFCKGTSALFASPSIKAEDKIWAETLFNKVGAAFWVDQESMIDTLTAPLGSAPAYIFLFLEALQKAAMSRGIPEELAEKIALESISGAVELAKKSKRSFAELRASVTTPMGITEHSLQNLSFTDFFDIFKQIYIDAEKRIDQIKHSLEV
jgi:pyrroline-5-carboxylate reductase